METETHNEWEVTFNEERIGGLFMKDRADCLDYIRRGVNAGHKRKNYGIVRREVLTVTTEWEEA